jgi:fructosamine-3-kinase
VPFRHDKTGIMTKWRQRVEAALGSKITANRPLSGGDIGDVQLLSLAAGRRVVAKAPQIGQPSHTRLEARMLNFLKSESPLPVPEIYYVDDDVLVMEFIESSGSLGKTSQQDAARHIAALHGVSADQFGLGFDTVIGPLHQPNRRNHSWVSFYRDQRLLYMAGECLDAGRIDAEFMARIDKFAQILPGLIEEPAKPALLHGDLWGGNILVNGDRIAGFIDPAIYFGHPEVDLAFSTLFDTFNSDFFDEYVRIMPLSTDFASKTRDIYSLWPLLVHVRLFGGSYAARVAKILSYHGC